MYPGLRGYNWGYEGERTDRILVPKFFYGQFVILHHKNVSDVIIIRISDVIIIRISDVIIIRISDVIIIRISDAIVNM